MFSPTKWFKNIAYRSDFLGWFVAAILFVVSAHLLLFIGLSLAILGFIPNYTGIFFLGVSLASINSLVYFCVRMFAPEETAHKSMYGRRKALILVMGVAVVVLNIIGIVAANYLGMGKESIQWIAWPFAVLLYMSVIAIGYDSARMNNTVDRISANSSIDSDHKTLFDIFAGKSKKKALLTAGICILVGAVIGVYLSVGAGMTATGTSAGILALIHQMYPDEEN